MFRLVIVASFVALAVAAPPKFQKLNYPNKFAQQIQDAPEEIIPTQPVVPHTRHIPSFAEIEEYQNNNAKYQFSSDVDDKISDLTQSRSETRDGKSVTGSYSYSDGYVMRTVHYVADDKGYRVTGEEVVPLAEGPIIDLNGRASVRNELHGTHLAYTVQSVPADGPVPKIIDSMII